jgi:hypothetical protein
MKPHHKLHYTTHQHLRLTEKTPSMTKVSFFRCAPYFSRWAAMRARILSDSAPSLALFAVALSSTALLMPCQAKEEAKEQDEAAKASTQTNSDSDEKKSHTNKSRSKQAKKSTAKENSPGNSHLHIGSSQEAIRAIEELPLPQGASATQNALPRTTQSAFKSPPTAPTTASKAQRAELPYLSDSQEPDVVTPKPDTTTKSRISASQSTQSKEELESDEQEDVTPGGTLAPAPLRGFPRFPSPIQKGSTKSTAPSVAEDERETTSVAQNFSQSTFVGNDAAQMRVGGAIARDEILKTGSLLKLEIYARNTGTSSWLSDDEMPVRVVVRWFDNNTKRRARWEIKWVRDEIAPGETLTWQPQVSVPRDGNFTVVVSLLRLRSSRFSPPSNDKAELKLPGEFARAVFQTEVRTPSPLASGLGGAEESVDAPAKSR